MCVCVKMNFSGYLVDSAPPPCALSSGSPNEFFNSHLGDKNIIVGSGDRSFAGGVCNQGHRWGPGETGALHCQRQQMERSGERRIIRLLQDVITLFRLL